jgi:hypothetical protein
MSDEYVGNDPHKSHSFPIELSSTKCGLSAVNSHGIVAPAGQTIFKLPNCGYDGELWTLSHKGEQEE